VRLIEGDRDGNDSQDSQMIIAALLLAALSFDAQVFPDSMCEALPEVEPAVKTWVAQVAPELAQVEVRALPEKTALDVFGRAAAAGWGSVDLLTQGVFREPCTFYFSREALRAVDAAFELDLVTVIRGEDTQGQEFEMTALLAGRGKLVVFYNRDGIIYRNERLARDFRLASRIAFDTPAAGMLENVQGLCAKVALFGCVRVHSLVKVGDTLKVLAGTFTSETPLKPIQARRVAAGVAKPHSTPDICRRACAHLDARVRDRRAQCRLAAAVFLDDLARSQVAHGLPWKQAEVRDEESALDAVRVGRGHDDIGERR
jgi:hypothetical protein